MKIAQKLLSTQGVLTLPLDVNTFESALRRHTHAATSRNVSGYAVKFDQENYPEPFCGRISDGQFQLRAVKKANRMEMANFLITGNYTPTADGGTHLGYTLSLNPKATVLWLLVIALFFVQLVFIQSFVMEGPSIFTFYAVAVPLAGLGWVVHRFNKMLAPSKQQWENDLNSLSLGDLDAIPTGPTSSPSLKSILGTLVFMGVVFLLMGIGAGFFTYAKVKRTTESAVGTVIDLAGNRKSYYPVISYTTKDGVERTYRSNYGSNPPIYKVGDTVPIFYDPAKPDIARVDNDLEGWFIPFGVGMGGVAFLIIAGLAYRNRTRIS